MNGAGGLLKNGSASLALTGTNAYTGSTIVQAGTLLLDFSAAGAPATNIISASSPLHLDGGTLAIRGSPTVSNSQTFAGLTLEADANTIALNKNGNATLPVVSLGAFSSFGAGSTLLVDASLGGTVKTTSGPSDGIYSPRIIYYNGAAFSWATSSASSPYPLIAFNALLALPPNSAIATNNYLLTGAATQTASQTVYSLEINPASSGGSLTISAGTLTIASGGLLMTGSNDYAINGGSLSAGSTSGYELLVQQFAATNNLTIGSAIVNDGANAVSITKAGPGTLTLTAANNGFTGAIYVLEGKLATSGNLGTTNTLYVGRSDTAGVVHSGGITQVSSGL